MALIMFCRSSWERGHPSRVLVVGIAALAIQNEDAGGTAENFPLRPRRDPFPARRVP